MTLQPEEGDTEQHELPAAPTKAVVQTMESQMECRWKRLDAVHQAAALQLGWVCSHPASATQHPATKLPSRPAFGTKPTKQWDGPGEFAKRKKSVLEKWKEGKNTRGAETPPTTGPSQRTY